MATEFDILFVNGKIRVSALRDEEVEALAVGAGGKIAAIGKSADLVSKKSANTKVIDLQGRRCVPSLIDGHCHPVRGVVAALFAVKFAQSDGPEAIEAALAQFLDKNPSADYVMGGRFSSEFVAQYADDLTPTPREWLDRISRGKAVYLRESSGHGAMANTRALEFLGIKKETPDPHGGEYVKDKTTGECNGVLLGEADMINRRKWPDYSSAQYDEAVREVVRMANSYGMGGIKDADVSEEIARAFRDADLAWDLKMRVSACLGTNFGFRDKAVDYERFEEWRTKYKSPHVDTNNLKLYIDGVPMSDMRTACFLEPYVNNAPKFEPDHRGALLCDQEVGLNYCTSCFYSI
jgi:predicted amidohydrolase YtcJ